jgi:zinc transporter ZupT
MNQNGDQQHTSFSSAITFWGALMVHSTLEGFGIGVTSSVQQAAIVFAITIHKGFESLALVGALADSKISFTLYCFLYGIFCCSVPAGAILGALLKSSSANSHFAGIITGLASGSFMYVIYFIYLFSPSSSYFILTNLFIFHFKP